MVYSLQANEKIIIISKKLNNWPDVISLMQVSIKPNIHYYK